MVVCEFDGCCLLGYGAVVWCVMRFGLLLVGLLACICIVGFGGIIAFCLGVCLL